MFNRIAGTYDFLNHFLSLGIDIYWRKKAIKKLRNHPTEHLLDIATGTGDFAFEAIRQLKPKKVNGIDIAAEMLEIAKKKAEKKGLSNTFTTQVADSEQIPFEDNTFDAASVSFGVRNFEHLEKGLQEIYRVLKPGGKLVVLEFSKPRTFPFKQLYNFYFFSILPLIGKVFSKDPKAYTYLPESVAAFPDGEKFTTILKRTGFKEEKHQSLTFGIVGIYTGTK